MSALLELPTELIEEIAYYLPIKDLKSLRLAHPAILPSQTMRPLRKLQESQWNAQPFTRTIEFPEEDDCDGRTWTEKEKSVALGVPHYPRRRDPSWASTLRDICLHPVFSTWLTSVAFAYRERHTGGYYEWHAYVVGLGQAVAKLPKLDTLHLWGYMGQDLGELWCLLEDFCNCGSTPPVRFLHVSDTICRGTDLSKLITKLHATLEEVVIEFSCSPEGSYVENLFPALQKCSLNYLCIAAPEAYTGEPDTRNGERIQFMDEVTDSHKHGQLVAKKFQLSQWSAPFTVAELNGGREQWAEAAARLMNAEEKDGKIILR